MVTRLSDLLWDLQFIAYNDRQLNSAFVSIFRSNSRGNSKIFSHAFHAWKLKKWNGRFWQILWWRDWSVQPTSVQKCIFDMKWLRLHSENSPTRTEIPKWDQTLYIVTIHILHAHINDQSEGLLVDIFKACNVTNRSVCGMAHLRLGHLPDFSVVSVSCRIDIATLFNRLRRMLIILALCATELDLAVSTSNSGSTLTWDAWICWI